MNGIKRFKLDDVVNSMKGRPVAAKGTLAMIAAVIILATVGIVARNRFSARTPPPDQKPKTIIVDAPKSSVGVVSGASWITKKDATSVLMRGMTVSLVSESIDSSEVSKFGLSEVAEWETLTRSYQSRLDNFQKEFDAKDTGTFRKSELKKDIDDHKKTIDDFQKRIAEIKAWAKGSSKQISAPDAYKAALRFDTEGLAHMPVLGLVKGGRTSVDGKYVIDGVSPGKYFLWAVFDSDGASAEWLVPVQIDAGINASVDLFNSNATSIYTQ